MIKAFNTHEFLGGDIIVNVTIPEEGPVIVPLIIEDVPVDMHPISGFMPKRVIANLVFVDPANPKEYLVDLPYPVEIKVHYHSGDFQAADGYPSLAYWDGSDWVRFTAKHNYTLEQNQKPHMGGDVTLTLTSWSDPPMAWGT